MSTELLTERQGRTLVLTLSGPATRNALTTQVLAAGIETLNTAEFNPDVGAVILTGAGDHFCAGLAVTESAAIQPSLAAQAELLDGLNQWIEVLRCFPKPVLASAEGVASGAGLALALACDLIVASEGARLLAHSSSGHPYPEGALTSQLSNILGRGRALSVLWSNPHVAASTWFEWGAIQRLTPTGHALNEALIWSEELAQQPEGRLACIKELVNEAPEHNLRQQLNAEKQHKLLHLARHPGGHAAA